MYYIDTCVWLSIFNKNEKDTPNGKDSKQVVEKILFEQGDKIIYSGFVLRELQYKLIKYYEEKRQYLGNEKEIIFVKANPNDYALARELEKKYCQVLSFFDFLHLAICKNNNYTLITFDKELIKISQKEISVFSPKELLKRIDFI